MKTGLVAALLALTFFVIGIFSLPHYGPNWDEPNHFGRGQSIVHFFLTGEKDYSKDLIDESKRRSFYRNDGFAFRFFNDKFVDTSPLTVGGHPPLSGILSAIFNKIFYERIGILGDIEAYHLYSVFVASIFIFVLFSFVNNTYGPFAAVITSLSLMTFPLFLGESRFNIKDIPEACYFGLTLICFYYALVKNSKKWMMLTAFVFGLGLATKLNILFALPIMFLWGVVRNRKVLLRSLFVISLVGAVIFLISWPMLWADPVNRILKVFAYYKGIGTNTGFDPRYLTIFRFNTYALQWILFTTPLVTLFLSVVGILSMRKDKNKISLLILLWFLVPIARVTLPHANIYGGVRQIMEYIPAMAILAGVGASYTITLLNGYIVKLLKRTRKKQFDNLAIRQLGIILKIGIILSFLPITLKMVSMYPNESVYFNPLIGGLKGAAERNIPGWGSSLGSTYRQGVKWLNENAEQNAKLATGFGLRSNIALIDLRPDIQFENRFRSGPRQDGEYIIGVTHGGTQEDLYMRKYLDRFLVPVYDLKVEGVSVLKIWKNDFENTKEPYMERIVSRVDAIVKHDNIIDIDIGNSVRLTRLIISYQPASSCSLPVNGYVEYSLNGDIWSRAANDLTSSPVSSYFSSQPEPGVVQFMFAADIARYIRLVILDKNSCLIDKPLQASVRHL